MNKCIIIYVYLFAILGKTQDMNNVIMKIIICIWKMFMQTGMCMYMFVWEQSAKLFSQFY